MEDRAQDARELENPALRRVMTMIRIDELDKLVASIELGLTGSDDWTAEVDSVLGVIRQRREDLQRELAA